MNCHSEKWNRDAVSFILEKELDHLVEKRSKAGQTQGDRGLSGGVYQIAWEYCSLRESIIVGSAFSKLLLTHSLQ